MEEKEKKKVPQKKIRGPRPRLGPDNLVTDIPLLMEWIGWIGFLRLSTLTKCPHKLRTDHRELR